MFNITGNQKRKVLTSIIIGYSIGAFSSGNSFEGIMTMSCLGIIWYPKIKNYLPGYMYEEEHCEENLSEQESINIRDTALKLASIKEMKKAKLPSAPALPRDERQKEGLLIFMNDNLQDCSYFSTENVLNQYGFEPIIVNKGIITRKLRNNEIPVIVQDKWWRGSPTNNTIIQRVDITGDLCSEFEHI